MRAKPFDVAGLVAATVAVLCGAVAFTEGAFVLGGFTLFIYACTLFAPGMGGRAGAAAITPLMGLLTITFAAVTGDVWPPVLAAAASARAGMLVVRGARASPPPIGAK